MTTITTLNAAWDDGYDSFCESGTVASYSDVDALATEHGLEQGQEALRELVPPRRGRSPG